MTGLRVVDRFILPKHDDRALRFLVNRLFIPHNRREWLWSGVARGVPGPVIPFPVGPPAGVPVEEAREIVDAILDWAHAAMPEETQSGLSFILHRDRMTTEWTRLVLFLFRAREREPLAVVKVAKSSLRAEWEALQFLSNALPSELRTTVPVPTFHCRFGAAEAVLMRALPGRSMDHEIGRRPARAHRVEHHLLNGVTWLACFHLVTRAARRTWQGVEETRLLEELLPELDVEAVPLELPLSASHGDFWARNLLVQRSVGARSGTMTDVSGVVDWERFSPGAAPFEDLFHFVLTYALDYPWAPFSRRPPLEAFRNGFLVRNAVSRAIRSALADYCDLTGLSFEALGPLFHLFLVRRFRAEEPFRSMHLLLAETNGSVFEV